MTIEFDPDRHQYLVDGTAVPSVTQLVAPLGEDYDEPDELTELAIDAAADRGTALHAYIAHRLQGGAPEDFELPDSYQGYVDAIELFFSEHTIEPYAIEVPLGCSAYAGTPDLVAEFDGKISILDWKFVSTIAKSKVGAQLGGYSSLCAQEGVDVEGLYAVQFLRDGDYRIYPVGPQATPVFLSCLALYGTKTQKHPRGYIFAKPVKED